MNIQNRQAKEKFGNYKLETVLLRAIGLKNIIKIIPQTN